MEDYIFLNLWAMRVIGVWYPEKISPLELKIYRSMRILTVVSVLFIIIPSAIAATNHLWQYNISTGVEILAVLISATVVFCKTLNIVLRRNEVRMLLSKMSDFWQDATTDEVEMITRFAEIGRRVTKWYIVLGFLSIMSFVGQPFLDLYLTGFANNTSDIQIRMPFGGWESFMTFDPSQSTTLIVFIFTSHVIAGMVASATSIGHDCLFVVLIFHVCGNLRAITKSLRQAKFFYNKVILETNIRRCGKKFQDLIDYTRELENMLRLILLAQSTSSTIIICLTGFLMSRDIHSNKEVFKYISFWSAALFQLFIFCWAANYLQTEAIKVGRSAYDAYGKLMELNSKDCQHHCHLLTKTPRYLQMILLRSQIPVKITAGNLYVMSLNNYKNILSTSYSYFTVLRVFADKKKDLNVTI